MTGRRLRDGHEAGREEPATVPAPPRAAPHPLLGMQAAAGNRATAGLVARAPAAPGAVVHKTAAEVKAMTLGAFDRFARGQADWAADPALSGDRDALRTLLEWARTEEAGKQAGVTGCGAMTVGDLLATGLDATALAELRAFAQAAAQTHDTVKLDPIADVAKAREYGKVLPKLEAVPGGVTMKKIINRPEALDRLMAAGAVDDFIAYCTQQQPVLHAEDDAKTSPEITSFLAMRADGDAALGPRLPTVRNLHRFEHAGLVAVADNYALSPAEVKKQARPLVLILHSSLDHNSAFHRDPNLTAVLTQGDKLVILVEGKASLGEMQGEIAPIAARYGHDGKIHQVMLAGHGNAKSMQLAGTLDAAGEEQAQDVRTKDKATDDFLAELVKNMASTPDSRIVLNACLTASNQVNPPPGGLSADPATAAAQVQAAIASDPSLTNRVAAAAAGTKIQVKGANASFGQVGLLDAKGNLDIVAAKGADPKLTASKAEYAKEGTEPEGVMRALLEVWSLDWTATPHTTVARDVVRERVKHGGTGWHERVIWALMRVVHAAPDNAELMRQCAVAAGQLAELLAIKNASWLHAGVPSAQANAIYTDLTGATDWGTDHAVPLLVLQAWQAGTPAKGADLTSHLGTHFTCRTAKEYVNIPFLQPNMGALLGKGSATPAKGPLTLACMGALAQPADAESVRFLKECAGTSSNFDPAIGMEGVLDNLASVADVEAVCGLGAAPAPPSGPSPPNTDLDGDGKPDVFVEPMDRRTATTTTWANLRARPDDRAPILGATREHGRLIVDGRSGDWLRVEHKTKPRFVHSRLVKVGKEPNVDMDGDGVNDFHVEPMTRRGAVAATHLNVRRFPGMDEPVVASLDKGANVDLIGTAADVWYAIEHAGRTRFVHRDWVTLTPSL